MDRCYITSSTLSSWAGQAPGFASDRQGARRVPSEGAWEPWQVKQPAGKVKTPEQYCQFPKSRVVLAHLVAAEQFWLLTCVCCRSIPVPSHSFQKRELGFRRSAAGTPSRWCVINELQIRNNTSRPADYDFIIIIFTPVISVVKALR